MYLIQSIQVPMQSYYLKLLNMCKFAHNLHIIEKLIQNYFQENNLASVKYTNSN